MTRQEARAATKALDVLVTARARQMVWESLNNPRMAVQLAEIAKDVLRTLEDLLTEEGTSDA